MTLLFVAMGLFVLMVAAMRALSDDDDDEPTAY
jgi:hypothetical protein